MSDAVARTTAALRDLNVAGEIRTFIEPVPTAAAAAAQLGCEVGAIANSLVFDADGEPLLILASGAHRVNTAKVAALLGAARIRRATPAFVLAATGQEVGGVAPVGHPAAIRTVVDTWLGRYEQVWAGAGDEMTMFCTSLRELERITGGKVADIE
ncbi:YbaK/EbsC family protein [Catellatospora vulcania]|uniref:YbaK/EbsC family protein n=1 Tax=Catellatospora vulcania TaxID=1460450 RepID=UPI0012D39D87|nr:YbaK/EbsC family protein [Catellatospora vulcania]